MNLTKNAGLKVAHLVKDSESLSHELRCLDEFTITGIQSTIPFHQKVLASDVFQNGVVCTDFIEKHMSEAPKALV